MIVLDTNVLSELMNPGGSEHVILWVDKIPKQDQFTTAVNQAEIFFGLAIMPKGRRRNDRISWADEMFADEFRGRILPFDERAAAHYADIVATRQGVGKRIQPIDAQIAAIARAHSMAIATRDVKDFQGCGIQVINPWPDEHG